MSCVERIGLHNVLLYLNTIYLHAIGQIPSRDVDKYALLTACLLYTSDAADE